MTAVPPAGSADEPPPVVGALALRLLGTFAVAHDGRAVEALPSDKACALLAMLAVDGAPIARATLTARLWPAAEPERARLSLRVALSALRRLAPGRLHADAASAAFVPRPGDMLDTAVVAAAVDSADPDRWRAAAAAYGGPLLGGRLSIDTPGFAAWLDDAAQRLDDQARTVLLRLADAVAGGDPAAALHALRRAAAIDPLDEPTQRHVALALARRGEHGAALAQLATLRVALSSEMGVDPAPETLVLRERIAAARERQAPPRRLPLPPSAFVGRAAELARLEHWLGEPSRHPDPSGGRYDLALPAEPDHPRAGRLVTIAGPGGIGKTRLAVELARRATHRLLDGACVVMLAGLEPGRAIEPSVAAELDLPPAAGVDAGDALARALERREIVLVLDNVEHVRDEAAGAIDRLLEGPDVRIVTTSREALGLPYERVLVLDGLAYPVGADDVARLDGFDAVDLFAAAARRIDPAFDAAASAAAVAEICRLVDGLPLAIELAAAWTATATCEAIADRLATDLAGLPVPRGLPARHAGLDAVFDYSWQLLSGADRVAFARLCVCRGGFDAAAAHAIAGAAADQLDRLVRKSLVRQVAPDRYDIHAVLRAAGTRRLGASEALAAQVAATHARHFLGTLAELGRASGAESPPFVRFADGDADNVAAAWRHAVVRRDRALVAAAALDLVAHAFAQGPSVYGIACCDDAVAVLTAPDGDGSGDADAGRTRDAGAPPDAPALVARLHAERAAFELRAGHAEVAEASVGRALDALAPFGDDPRAWPAAAHAAASVALRLRGVLRRMAGRTDDAAADLDDARRRAEAADDARLAAEAAYHRAGLDAYRGQTQACVDGTAAVLAAIEGRGYDRLTCALTFTLAVLHDRLGQPDRAAAAARRCLAVAVDAGYRVGEMNAAAAMGLVDQRAGAFDAAIVHYERSLQLAVDAGHHVAERNARLGLAESCLELGRPAEARLHAQRARIQAEAEGYRRTAAFATVLLARLDRCGHRLAAAARSAGDGLAAFEDLGDAAGVAMARAEIGVLQAWSGDDRAAATLDGAVTALEEAGEASLAFVARLHRARLVRGGGSDADRLAAAEGVRRAAAAAGLPTLVPMADVVIGHIRRPADPAAAAAAYEAARARFASLGQAHLAIEAVAGLLRCPGGLAPGAAALRAAVELTPVLLRQRLFGVPDPAATVAAFRDALAVVGDGRVAAVGGLRVGDAGDTGDAAS